MLSDAKGEVARGIENVEFACGVPHLLKGGFSEQPSRGVDVYSIRQPLGVVAGITPFNFPAMVPMWMFANAIACGNTFILKPSEKDPSPSLFFADLWQRGGAARRRVLTSCRAHAKRWIDCSITPRSRRCRSWARRRLLATSMRQGRAMASACRRSAVRRTTWSSCPTRTSRLPRTRRCLRGTARPGSAAWRSRPWSRWATSETAWWRRSPRASRPSRSAPATIPPPRWDRSSRASIATRSPTYLEDQSLGGSNLVVDGRGSTPVGDGFFLGPSLVDHVKPGSRVYDDEIFGPVLSVVRVDTYDEAIRLVNDNQYGNGVAIFTRDGGAARKFQFEVQVGMVGVNVPIPVPVAYYSFGGWKASCSVTRICTDRTACTSTRGPRWSRRDGRSRDPAAWISRFPATAEAISRHPGRLLPR